MRRKPAPAWAVLAVLAVLVAAGLAALPLGGAGPTSPAPQGERDGPAADAWGDATPDVFEADPAPQPLLRPERTPPPPSDLRCVGRCVDWQSGAPLAGCRISLTGSPSVTSDRDGAFTAPVPRDAASVEVVVEAGGRVAVARALEVEAHALTLGEVRLRAGTTLRGELADERGVAQEGALVLALCDAHVDREDGWQERFATRTRTRADGSFTFPAPLPTGAVTFAAPGAPPLTGETAFTLHPGTCEVRLTCRRVGPHDTIRGVVVDRSGSSVAGALVQAFAGHDASTPPLAWARTDEQGRFTLYRPEQAPQQVWPTALGTHGAEHAAASQSVPWGIANVTLTLPAGSGVWVHVVDAGTGNPIEDFAIQCVPVAGVRQAGDGAVRGRGPHQDGWALVDGLGPGSHEMIVWPEGTRWLANLPQRFDRDGCGGTVRVELQAAQDCPVRVMDADGVPVAGVDVELLAPADGDVVRDLDRLFAHGRSRSPTGVRLGRAVSDARGIATLAWFDDATPRQLRLSGPAIAPHVESHVRVSPAGTTVRLAASGQLALRLSGAGGCRIELWSDDPTRGLPPPWRPPITLDANGLATVPVPAGSWKVALVVPTPSDAGPAAWLPTAAPIATVDVAAGQTTTLTRDLRAALEPGEIGGVAFVDGAPAAVVALLCGGEDANGEPRIVHTLETTPDARGAFRFGGLRSGRYRVQLCFGADGRRVAVAAGPWTTLGPGERRGDAGAAITTTRVVVHARDAEGRAVREGWIVLKAAPDTVLLGALDATGAATFARVPRGRYELRLRQGNASTPLGELIADDAAIEHTATLR